MTLYSTLFPDAVRLLSRKWWKESGNFNYTIPADFGGVVPGFMRASLHATGGQSDEQWGGGSTFVLTRAVVAPGQVLQLRVGRQSQGDENGDSYVRRAGVYLAYAARGRGAGPGGLAADSIGDVKRDGQVASYGGFGIAGGIPGSDENDYASLGFFGRGATSNGSRAANPGAGGRLHRFDDEFGNFAGYTASPTRPGRICLEFFDANPGY